MSTDANRAALVTGASTGLGFEAAAQLAEAGYERVIITARTDAKAAAARADLEGRTSADVFETLTLDMDDLPSVSAATAMLAERGGQIDVVLLNAGIAPTNTLKKTADGIEATVAATLTGHHLLMMRLLQLDLIANNARIVIAGSEAARGDVPLFAPVDIDELASEHFDGDVEAAIGAQMRMEPPVKYHAGNQYATVKMFAVWWAKELADRLPAGTTVNAVSPGSTPDTDVVRDAPFLMRWVLLPVIKLIPSMSHPVDAGAARYVEVVGYGPEETGKFYASKPKKMTGPLHEIQSEHFDNPSAQKALWNVTTAMVGGADYAS